MKKFLFAIIGIITLASCAKQETEDISGLRLETFKMWMAANHPDAVQLESGAFVEWIERSGSGIKLKKDYWMKINYTGRLLNDRIYVTRSAETARQLGIFTTSTHYVPDYLPFYPNSIEEAYYHSSYNLAHGQALILKDMEEGDSVRVYLPYYLGFNYTDFDYSSAAGFANLAVDAQQNIIIEMKLVEVVPEPTIYERNQVERYAQDSLGITDLDDYVVPGLYLTIIDADPTGDPITEDTLVSVRYVGQFMDGFVFDTNIDTVAVKHKIYDASNASKYSQAETFYPSEDCTFVEGFWQSILKMRKGEHARVVFISSLGYGSEGSGSIQPYTPLVFDLFVEGTTTQ